MTSRDSLSNPQSAAGAGDVDRVSTPGLGTEDQCSAQSDVAPRLCSDYEAIKHGNDCGMSPAKRKPTSLSTKSPTCSSPARDDFTKKKKIAAIHRALQTEPVDVLTLRQLCISRGGLLQDDLRKEAWAKLLFVNVEEIPSKPDTEILHSHADYNQVVLDVNRSLKRFPPGMETEVRLGLQDQLTDVIMWVLVSHPELHYYQGYHDICVTFLLVVGEDLTFALMDKLSVNHFRDFMDQNMNKTNHMLNYLYPIVGRASPLLQEFMIKSEVGTIFSLSWLITWYGHVLSEFPHIVRLYDFFIACHPLMPIYLAAAIVLYRESEVLTTDCEMCMVHSLLSKIPHDLPLEQLITRAGDLYVQYPPDMLESEARMHYEIAQQKYEDNRKVVAAHRALNKNSRGTMNANGLLVKLTVWSLTAALSAAVLAVFRSTPQWEWLWRS